MDRCQLNASFSFLKMMQHWSYKVPLLRKFHLSMGLFLILLLCLHRLKEPFPQHQLQCWLLKTWRDCGLGKILGKLLASSVFGSTPACLMGWALWVKLQPPLRIPWNETALMLKALWVRQHCADKPKTWRLESDWNTSDTITLMIFGLLWIFDAKDFIWELDEKFLSRLSCSLPPPLPPHQPFFKSLGHSVFQAGQVVPLEVKCKWGGDYTARTWPQMVTAGYSKPAMSFPVVSNDVITGWFSQSLKTLFQCANT